VTVALLRALGADAEPGADVGALERVALAEVLGGGQRVGEIRVVIGAR